MKVCWERRKRLSAASVRALDSVRLEVRTQLRADLATATINYLDSLFDLLHQVSLLSHFPSTRLRSDQLEES